MISKENFSVEEMHSLLVAFNKSSKNMIERVEVDKENEKRETMGRDTPSRTVITVGQEVDLEC
jgi:hypothetical protein